MKRASVLIAVCAAVCLQFAAAGAHAFGLFELKDATSVPEDSGIAFINLTTFDGSLVAEPILEPGSSGQALKERPRGQRTPIFSGSPKDGYEAKILPAGRYRWIRYSQRRAYAEIYGEFTVAAGKVNYLGTVTALTQTGRLKMTYRGLSQADKDYFARTYPVYNAQFPIIEAFHYPNWSLYVPGMDLFPAKRSFREQIRNP